MCLAIIPWADTVCARGNLECVELEFVRRHCTVENTGYTIR